MSDDIKNSIEKLQQFMKECGDEFKKDPVIQSGEHAAIVQSNRQAAQALASIKQQDDKISEIIKTAFTGDLELIEDLENDTKELEAKIALFSPDQRKEAMERLNQRTQILQEFDQTN